MRDDLELITINDFSPGIHADYHYAGTETPGETVEGHIQRNGAATIEDTYRCCADRTGALIPLPKLVAGKTSAPMPIGDNASTQYLGGVAVSYLLDGMVRGDMFVATENNPVNADRAGVYVMYGQSWYNTGQTATFQWTVIGQFHRLFDGPTDKHDLLWARFIPSMNGLSPIQIGSGNFVYFRGRRAVEADTHDGVAYVAYGSPGYSAIALDGGPVVVGGNIPAGEQALTDFDTHNTAVYPGQYGRVIGLFPHPDQDQSDLSSAFMDETRGDVPSATFNGVCWLVGHQGRLIGITRTPTPAGISGGSLGSIAESVWTTPVQDFFGSMGFECFEKAQFAEEKQDRTGAVASITADEIIFIKDRGGAVIVRGDMANPTVIQQPYVESTHGARSIPVATTIGLVYGTRNGVYLWEGGDASRSLSPQLDGWFWNHDTVAQYLGVRGRFGWWNPWVCAPNNFLYDTRTEGWWRLDSPTNTGAACNAYDVSNESNRLYAFPYKLTATQNTMWWTATPDVQCRTYTWKSQPLVQSLARLLSVHEVHLVVSPGSSTAATIDVTISGYDKNGAAVTPVTTTFTTTANKNTQILHKDVVTNFQASHLQITIVANSGSDSQPAPKVHSVSIACGSRARLAKG